VRDCGVLSQLPPGDRALILGHTHEPLRCEAGGRWLFNPGSVGQSRERRPVARAVVLDAESLEADFLALDYDVQATRRDLRAAGLPPSACHLAPGRTARLRRRLEALSPAV
jgi:diadenosine tetraphosphatase ApaH/serine/threonine PP2A family protein phosphatase